MITLRAVVTESMAMAKLKRICSCFGKRESVGNVGNCLISSTVMQPSISHPSGQFYPTMK
ncbi:hypothetical protein SLEP1_g40190 [Rubroshorea leprosula]|uniref:Uncharacterized protein n=1 Tax=Rubroshorea leprosula TaxID=152421 RepID=A0AAV5L2V0_9ROSI|nr:hypothetical protein SLEP1_g40190 [Rubroshorea leprosula]